MDLPDVGDLHSKGAGWSANERRSPISLTGVKPQELVARALQNVTRSHVVKSFERSCRGMSSPATRLETVLHLVGSRHA